MIIIPNPESVGDYLARLEIEMELIIAQFDAASTADDIEAAQFHLERYKQKVQLHEIAYNAMKKKYYEVFGRTILSRKAD